MFLCLSWLTSADPIPQIHGETQESRHQEEGEKGGEQETADDEPAPSSSRRRSLPRHLERAQVRLTNLLAKPEAWAGLHDAFGAALRELDGLGEVGATRGARREGGAARLQPAEEALC